MLISEGHFFNIWEILLCHVLKNKVEKINR